MIVNASTSFHVEISPILPVLIETSWVMFAPSRLQAEAGHAGYGPASAVWFSLA